VELDIDISEESEKTESNLQETPG